MTNLNINKNVRKRVRRLNRIGRVARIDRQTLDEQTVCFISKTNERTPCGNCGPETMMTLCDPDTLSQQTMCFACEN